MDNHDIYLNSGLTNLLIHNENLKITKISFEVRFLKSKYLMAGAAIPLFWSGAETLVKI